jgi:hypothetical protein
LRSGSDISQPAEKARTSAALVNAGTGRDAGSFGRAGLKILRNHQPMAIRGCDGFSRISQGLLGQRLPDAFDMWMRRNHPGVPFERYADDAICHCRSEAQARTLRASKIVYCKDEDRRGGYPHQTFDASCPSRRVGTVEAILTLLRTND